MKNRILLITLLLFVTEILFSQTILNIETFLNENPNIKSHIIWETEADVFVEYDSWDQQMKTDLQEIINKITLQEDLNIQDPVELYIKPESGELVAPTLAYNDAWKIYLAHIAQSIVVDYYNYVSWNLADATVQKLDHLFNSNSFYKCQGSYYEVLYEHGCATLGNPLYVFGFLKSNNLIGFDEKNTIERILDWGRDNMFHYGIRDEETGETSYLRCFDGFEGWFPPIKTIIDGVYDTQVNRVYHWSKGCHGTTGFLKGVCRVLNIEVKDNFDYNSPNIGHSVPIFPGINAFLCHADDIYSTCSKTFPRRDISRLLNNFDNFETFFSSENEGKYVVYNDIKDFLEYIPYDLYYYYCIYESNIDNIIEHYGINLFYQADEIDSLKNLLQIKIDSFYTYVGSCYSNEFWSYYYDNDKPPFHNYNSEADILSVSLNAIIQNSAIDTQKQIISIDIDESELPDSLYANFICSDWASIKQLNNNRIEIDRPNIFEVISEDSTNIKIWKLIFNETEDCQANYSETVNICQGYEYNGWTKSGQYQKIYQNESCDSVVTTNLIVNPAFHTTEEIDISICMGESYNGWDTEGGHTETYSSVSGCDSIVIINLSFFPTYQPEITNSGDTIESSTNYQAYQWYDDSGAITNATDASFVIQKSGTYWLEVVDENGCTQTSETINLIYSSATDISLSEFKYSIIPNPNNGKFSFRIDSKPPKELKLMLLNITGQLIEIRIMNNAKVNSIEKFDLSDLKKGIYLLVIDDKDFQISEKIIIN